MMKKTYGRCPKCGAYGISRERRFDGFDKCFNGHSYRTSCAVYPVRPLELALKENEALKADNQRLRKGLENMKVLCFREEVIKLADFLLKEPAIKEKNL